MYILQVLFVVAVVVLCESTNVAKRNEGCLELANCLEPLNTTLQNAGIQSIVFLSTVQYGEVCRANTGIQSCFAAKKANCDDPSVTAEDIDYLCSDEGRVGHERIVNSQCVINEIARLAARESMKGCVDNFNLAFQLVIEDAQSESLCPLINTLSGCILSSQTDQCGNDFGTFAKKLWAISYRSTAVQMGCDLQVR